MFHELVESAAVRKQTRQGFAAVASATVQAACLLVLLLLPLIYTQALPTTIMSAFLIAPAPALSPERPAQPAQQSGRRQIRLLTNNVLREPAYIPPVVAVFQEAPLPTDSSLDSRISDAQSGLDLLSGTASAPGPVRPQPPAPTAKRVQLVGGSVQAAKIISQSNPVYPVLARQAGIQGEVVLRAIIDDEGRVSELQVVSGSPLLVRAALDAVKTWRYQPTLLNGEPVEVDTTITVSFVLSGSRP
jgi:protein TonB